MANDEVPEGSPQKARKIIKALKAFQNIILFSKKGVNSSISETIAEIVSNDENQANEDDQIILNVANMTSDKIEEVMTPRSDIVAINIVDNFDVAREVINQSGHSRVPLFYESLDNIKGYIHIKDILLNIDNTTTVKLEKIIRHPLFVPPSMRIVDLLRKMHISKVHIAIVIDEYGGTDGLVTLEDLTEQMLGELDEEEVLNIGEKSYEVNARVKIEELEEKLGLKFSLGDDYDFDTLAGYIVFLLGRIPEEGEVIEHELGIRFIVKEAEPRFIKKVIIET